MSTPRMGDALVSVAIATSSLLAQPAPSSAGPWMGLWKLNPEKTAAASNRPAPAAGPGATRFFRMVPVRNDAFKYTIEVVPPNGGPPTVTAELIGRFDGQDYIEIGNPGADTNKFRIIDSHTYEVTDTKDGKDLLTIRVSISPDGKTRTSVSTGRNAQGQDTRTISIYDRVE